MGEELFRRRDSRGPLGNASSETPNKCTYSKGFEDVSIHGLVGRKENFIGHMWSQSPPRHSATEVGIIVLPFFPLLLSRNVRKDLALGTSLGCLIVRLVEERETERRGRGKSWFGLHQRILPEGWRERSSAGCVRTSGFRGVRKPASASQW